MPSTISADNRKQLFSSKSTKLEEDANPAESEDLDRESESKSSKKSAGPRKQKAVQSRAESKPKEQQVSSPIALESKPCTKPGSKAETVHNMSGSKRLMETEEGNGPASEGLVGRPKKPKPDSEQDSEDDNDDAGVSAEGVDLTTMEGQMKTKPWMSEDEAKVEAKREYNRRNAARARLRNKNMVKELQSKCAELTKLAEKLKQENDILKARLDVMSRQNQTLMSSSHPEPPPASASAGGGGGLQNTLQLLSGILSGQSEAAAPVLPDQSNLLSQLHQGLSRVGAGPAAAAATSLPPMHQNLLLQLLASQNQANGGMQGPAPSPNPVPSASQDQLVKLLLQGLL